MIQKSQTTAVQATSRLWPKSEDRRGMQADSTHAQSAWYMDSTALHVCVCVCVCVCSQSRGWLRTWRDGGSAAVYSTVLHHWWRRCGTHATNTLWQLQCENQPAKRHSTRQKHKKQGESPCPSTPSKTPANHLCRGGFVNRDVQNACTLSCSLSPLLPGFPLALHRCGRNRPRKSPRYVH